MKLQYKVIRQNGMQLFLLLGILAISGQGSAQLNPFGAAYFQNQYLFNPALSGLENQLNIQLGYRKEWNSVPGGPVNQYLTGDYGITNKVGLGLNLFHEKAGVLATTRAMATYSYHIPINDAGRKIHFGLSAGVLNRRIDKSDLNGDPDDPSLTDASRLRFDADFGAAYTDDKLTVQAAFPYMVTFFGKNETDVVNKPTFFAAASYKLSLNSADNITLEPKVAFRGVKGYDNIIDAGANLFIGKYLNLFGLYHSSKNVTIGTGLHLKNKLVITAIYTTAASDIKAYTGGNFELGIAVSFFQDK